MEPPSPASTLPVSPEGLVNDPYAAPHWQTIQRQVLCPLCDYDLRGLVEPRCPECGYAFAWPELLEAHLAPHPYLFEHHPRRNVRSFLRTLAGTLRPRRFWESISPTQPISVRRIAVYWLIVGTMIVLASAGGRFAANAVRSGHSHQVQRRQLLAMHRNPPDPYTVRTTWGVNLGTFLDQTWPMPHQFHFWRVLWERDSETGFAIKIGLCAAAWPLLVLLTLTIFTRTIRRAAIKRAHLLRCAVYSSVVLVFLLVLPTLIAIARAPFGPVTWYGRDSAALAIAFLALAALMTYYLAVAFGRYLRFPHAAATAVAVQFIVMLAVVVFLLQDRRAFMVVMQLF